MHVKGTSPPIEKKIQNFFIPISKPKFCGDLESEIRFILACLVLEILTGFQCMVAVSEIFNQLHYHHVTFGLHHFTFGLLDGSQ